MLFSTSFHLFPPNFVRPVKTHTHAHTHTYTRKHTRTRTHTHTHAHAHAHTHMHTHTHTLTHTSQLLLEIYRYTTVFKITSVHSSVGQSPNVLGSGLEEDKVL